MNLMLFPTPQHKADEVPSDAELARFIPGNAIAAGRAYAQAGRVLRMTVSEDGNRIEAETQGSRRTPYAETIVLRRDPHGTLRITGLCSCTVRSNCKHVAAVLIVARGRHKLAPAPVQALTMSPAPPRLVPPPRQEEPLPYPLANWLAELESAQQADEEDYPPSIRQRLFYLLDKAPQARGIPALSVQPVSVQLRKTGELAAIQRNFLPESIHGQQPARYLRPSDRIILRRLARRRHGNDEDEDPQDTVRRILATGRARWGSITGPLAHEGPPRPGRIVWVLNEDGSQHPEVTLEPPAAATLLRVPEPWYAEPETGTLGPVALDMPAPLARRLLAAPAIAPEQAARVRQELARRMPSVTVPAPDELPPPEVLNQEPRPHLLLLTGTPPLPHGMAHYGGGPAMPLARLHFGYGPFVVGPNERHATMARGGRLYRLVRHRDAEERLAQRMASIGFERVGRIAPSWYANPWSDDLMLPGDSDGAAWLRVLLDDVPALRAEGWVVEVADDFPIRLAEPEGDLSAELEEGSGIDWLELHLGVMVDGKRVDLVPSLVALIAASDALGFALPDRLNQADDDKPFLVPLRDGRFLPLPLPRIRPILLALAELFARGGVDPEGGAIRFTRLDAADVAALEEASGVVWQGGESLRSLGRQLREAGGSIPSAVIPGNFRGTLRPYQSQGVDWLQFLRGAELGGVLADDMGLGKTVQTLAHLAIEQTEGRLDRPSLIVCPTSVVPNWTMEAARFAPSLRLLTLHGPTRKEKFREIAQHDLVISTYPLLTRDHAVLTQHEWHVVVLDEAQMIKNPNAETTRQALRLRARQRLCLSGTPLQNHLGELWSLFDFLAPGFLGSARSFRTRFRTPIEKHGDAARGEMLTKRVRPFLLRRTKEEVALDLPPKTEITEQVEMEAVQRGIYESIRLAMHARVRQAIAEKGLARSGIIILDALLKMRQACCDPRLLKLKAVEKTRAGSAKLERLMELLTVLLAEGRRVLLFSQFTSMLALIQERLAAADFSHVTLTGDTADRATPVRRFQAGEVPLFLISLKAGGVGLNLTAADTVIHYDPWWNPAVEDQATDRAHRIGQDKKVFVHRLVTLGTIEEKMEVLKEKKRAIVASVLEAEHGGALRLTEGDVEELFGVG